MCETDETNRFCNENMYNVLIYVVENVLFTYEFSYKLHLFSYYYINNAMKSPL